MKNLHHFKYLVLSLLGFILMTGCSQTEDPIAPEGTPTYAGNSALHKSNDDNDDHWAEDDEDVTFEPQEFCSGWSLGQCDGTEPGNPPTCQTNVFMIGTGSLLVSRDNLCFKTLPTTLKGNVVFRAWAFPATDSNTNFFIILGDSKVSKEAILIRVNETNRWFADTFSPEVPVANYSLTWTKIKIVINTDQNTFSLWLDDVLVAQDKPTQASISGGINSFGLTSGRGTQPHASYIDDIRMSVDDDDDEDDDD